MVGCATNKFTRQRYETLYNGQPASDVELTLGPPQHKFSDTWTYVHDKPYYRAIIAFDENGRLIDKQWYDTEEMGDHPDSRADDESIDAGGAVIIDSSSGTSGTIDQD